MNLCPGATRQPTLTVSTAQGNNNGAGGTVASVSRSNPITMTGVGSVSGQPNQFVGPPVSQSNNFQSVQPNQAGRAGPPAFSNQQAIAQNIMINQQTVYQKHPYQASIDHNKDLVNQLNDGIINLKSRIHKADNDRIYTHIAGFSDLLKDLKIIHDEVKSYAAIDVSQSSYYRR